MLATSMLNNKSGGKLHEIENTITTSVDSSMFHIFYTILCCKLCGFVEGKSYTSFQKAVDSMKSGQTLTVLAEINTKDTVVIKARKKKININFARNKYSYNVKEFAFDIKSGNVTIFLDF